MFCAVSSRLWNIWLAMMRWNFPTPEVRLDAVLYGEGLDQLFSPVACKNLDPSRFLCSLKASLLLKALDGGSESRKPRSSNRADPTPPQVWIGNPSRVG